MRRSSTLPEDPAPSPLVITPFWPAGLLAPHAAPPALLRLLELALLERDGIASTKPLEDHRSAVAVDRISSKFGHGGGGARGGGGGGGARGREELLGARDDEERGALQPHLLLSVLRAHEATLVERALRPA